MKKFALETLIPVRVAAMIEHLERSMGCRVFDHLLG
jgi:hypothetical protein